jgi:hypothetical protein
MGHPRNKLKIEERTALKEIMWFELLLELSSTGEH